MSLTINVAMTTKDGGTVATGSWVQFDAYFPVEAGQYNANISVWRDEATKDSGMRTVNPVEIGSLNFTRELTPAEFAALTPVTMHEDVQAHLESYLGGGTVSINS